MPPRVRAGMVRFVAPGAMGPISAARDDEEVEESETESDSDELLGTHISDEEDAPTKFKDRRMRASDPEKQAKFVPEHEQEVTDEQGRRRFHGAFTGGFSAGYYNSVGTEEGWAPSEWRSSRGERAAQPAQRPEDFMDEEDLQEHQSEQRLVARGGYASRPPLSGASRPQDGVGDHGGVGGRAGEVGGLGDRLGAMLGLSGTAESVGQRMLRSMGWRDGFGIGPRRAAAAAATGRGKKVYGCAPGPCAVALGGSAGRDEEDDSAAAAAGLDVTLAPRAVASVPFVPKNNLHGVGYDPMRDAPEFGAAAAGGRAAGGGARAGGAAVRGPRGLAGGLRSSLPLGYDDDDDGMAGGTGRAAGGTLGFVRQVEEEDMSQYDLFLDTPGEGGDEDRAAPATRRGAPGSAPNVVREAVTDGRFGLRGFVQAQRPPPPEPWFDGPAVPSHFREEHVCPPPAPAQLPEAVLAVLRKQGGPWQMQSAGGAGSIYGEAGLSCAGDCSTCGGEGSAAGGLVVPAVAHAATGSAEAAAAAEALLSADLTGVWGMVGRDDMLRLWQTLQAMRAPLPVPPQPSAGAVAPPPPPPPRTAGLGFCGPHGAAAAGAAAAAAHCAARAVLRAPPKPSGRPASAPENRLEGVNGGGYAHSPSAEAAPPPGGWVLPPGCEPYAADPPKQARFESFLTTSRGGASGGRVGGGGAGGASGREERDEFRQVAAFFSRPKHAVINERFTSSEMQVSMPPAGLSRPRAAPAPPAEAQIAPAAPTAAAPGQTVAGPTAAAAPPLASTIPGGTPDAAAAETDAARAAAAGLFGALTRRREPWAPEPLLCKRFNVPVPVVSAGGGGGAARAGWEQTMTFNNALLDVGRHDAPTATGRNGPPGPVAPPPAPPVAGATATAHSQPPRQVEPPPPPARYQMPPPGRYQMLTEAEMRARPQEEQQRKAREATDALLLNLSSTVGTGVHQGPQRPPHPRQHSPPPVQLLQLQQLQQPPPPPRAAPLGPAAPRAAPQLAPSAAEPPPLPAAEPAETCPPLDLFRAIFADSDDDEAPPQAPIRQAAAVGAEPRACGGEGGRTGGVGGGRACGGVGAGADAQPAAGAALHVAFGAVGDPAEPTAGAHSQLASAHSHPPGPPSGRAAAAPLFAPPSAGLAPAQTCASLDAGVQAWAGRARSSSSSSEDSDVSDGAADRGSAGRAEGGVGGRHGSAHRSLAKRARKAEKKERKSKRKHKKHKHEHKKDSKKRHKSDRHG